jgi:hypothetical protein
MIHFFLTLFIAAVFGLPGLIGFMIGDYEAHHHHHCDDDWS